MLSDDEITDIQFRFGPYADVGPIRFLPTRSNVHMELAEFITLVRKTHPYRSALASKPLLDIIRAETTWLAGYIANLEAEHKRLHDIEQSLSQ